MNVWECKPLPFGFRVCVCIAVWNTRPPLFDVHSSTGLQLVARGNRTIECTRIQGANACNLGGSV